MRGKARREGLGLWSKQEVDLKTIVAGTLVAALAIAGTADGSAESTAAIAIRPATDADLQVKEWTSPVTVDVPLVGLAEAPDKTAWYAPSMPKFFCDDVTIDSIDVTKTPTKRDGQRSLVIWVHLRTRRQQDDKAVTLELSIHAGERTRFLGRIEDIEVPAGESQGVRHAPLLTTGEQADFLAAGKSAVLRIAMIVRTN